MSESDRKSFAEQYADCSSFAAAEFIRNHPEFYPHPRNSEAIINYIKDNTLDPLSDAAYNRAFEAVRGTLIQRPPKSLFEFKNEDGSSVCVVKCTPVMRIEVTAHHDATPEQVTAKLKEHSPALVDAAQRLGFAEIVIDADSTDLRDAGFEKVQNEHRYLLGRE